MTNEQVLRTGVLFKKGSGQGPFGRRNWKPRYFVLTPTKLTYYTYEDGDLKGELNLQNCNEQSLEVMPADAMKTGSSASTIWRIAINANDRRLLVAAGTEMEMNDWVEQFRVAFSMNSGQPLPPSRGSMNLGNHPIQPVSGAIATTATGDYSRNSITDFQNFAGARKSVAGGGIRASMGVHGGHEFRLSDEHERQRQIDEQRQRWEMEEERKREEEALQTHLRSQAEERRRQKELQQQTAEEQRAEQERLRQEQLLDEQRRLKREQHERERQEAERQLRELELQEQEKRHEAEIRRHLDEDRSRGARGQSRSPSRSPTRSPTGPQRSVVITDAKREAMARQQIEHNRQREAAIKEQHEQKRREFLEQKKQQEDAIRARHMQANKPPSPPAPPVQERHARTPPQSPPMPPKPRPSEQAELRSKSSYEF